MDAHDAQPCDARVTRAGDRKHDSVGDSIEAIVADPAHDRSASTRSQPVCSDQRGAVFAEYAVVMVCVTLLVGFAVAALGVPLFNLYAFSETVIGLPIP